MSEKRIERKPVKKSGEKTEKKSLPVCKQKDKEYGRTIKRIKADFNRYQWLISFVAVYNFGHKVTTDKFIEEFGTLGLERSEIFQTVKRLIYQDKTFRKQVELFRMNADKYLAKIAPFVLATARLKALSDQAERAIKKNQTGIMLDCFKSIREELGVGKRDGVGSINLKAASDKGNISITVGELLGISEDGIPDYNPEKAETGKRIIDAARKTTMLLKEGKEVNGVIDTEATDIDDDDIIL